MPVRMAMTSHGYRARRAKDVIRTLIVFAARLFRSSRKHNDPILFPFMRFSHKARPLMFSRLVAAQLDREEVLLLLPLQKNLAHQHSFHLRNLVLLLRRCRRSSWRGAAGSRRCRDLGGRGCWHFHGGVLVVVIEARCAPRWVAL